MEFAIGNIAVIFILLFLSITFLQSGIDKVVDWKGNLSWLNGHFAKTFFKNQVPLALGTILILEILTGILSIAGIVVILISGNTQIAFYASMLSGITLLMLFFGQRIAKDYPGAMTLAVYFIITIMAIHLLSF